MQILLFQTALNLMELIVIFASSCPYSFGGNTASLRSERNE